jgi:hypothetical protein
VDDTVSGQLVEHIMASIAQFYSANLAEEVKKGMKQKLLRGGWPHLPPCGYVSVKNSDGRGSHVEVQTTSSFDFRWAIDNKKIILCNLSKGALGEDVSSLLGSLVVTKLSLAALSRQNVPE